jgi:UDP-N-acetylglucosamine 1-carboxyvinyltransferase
MQPQFVTLLSIASGTSIITETIFNERDKHIYQLKQMGADIIIGKNSKTPVVKGVDHLKGTTVTSNDLRGGAALILAGLAARGRTIVKDSSHVQRGYEAIEETLRELGADIILKQ